jgi:hypothetical protein
MSNVPSRGELILYRTEDGREGIRLRVVDGTIWLSQTKGTPSRNSVVKESLTTDPTSRGVPPTCKPFLQVGRDQPSPQEPHP